MEYLITIEVVNENNKKAPRTIRPVYYFDLRQKAYYPYRNDEKATKEQKEKVVPKWCITLYTLAGVADIYVHDERAPVESLFNEMLNAVIDGAKVFTVYEELKEGKEGKADYEYDGADEEPRDNE